MPGDGHLAWPFFADEHRRYATDLAAWTCGHLSQAAGEGDERARSLVRELGAAGWLRACVPARWGGLSERVDLRTVCLAREHLARADELADFAFAMQGLGSLPITLFGSDALRERYLPPVARGERIAAFALSEPDAGSDVAALTTSAVHDGSVWVLDGIKTWISNAGIADHYVVFARTGRPGRTGIGAFVVDADTPGLSVTERIATLSPHPLGTLRFEHCRVAGDRMLGASDDGFAIAMATLDAFRPSVGAAALGFARRALAEAVGRVRERVAFGSPIAKYQLTQARLAAMALDVDASALLVYRAAWAIDQHAGRTTLESSMAKLFATEAAQRVVDSAVQLFGAVGVVSGMPVERLYRSVRALRIYEGTSEIQHLVIGRETLAAAEAG